MTIEEIIQQELEAQAKIEGQTRFHGYKVSDLRQVFNGITSSLKNWKQPFTVGGLMGEDVLPVVAAIKYFCGDGKPEVLCNTETMRYTVSTVGYYQATGEC